MKRKYLIIILLLSSIVILGLIYFLFLKSEPNKNQDNQETETSDVSSKNSLSENLNGDDSNLQAQPAIEKDINSIDQLVNKKFPETDLAQLNSFLEIAVSGSMKDCEVLSENEDKCKYYFSIYTGNSGFCGDINDKTIQFDCYKELILKDISTRFAECKNKEIVVVKVNCFRDLFWAIDKNESCNIFSDQEINQYCLDSINLKNAIAHGQKNCSLISDLSFKNFCEQFFAVGDFDNDGLSDAEEARIGTNPYLSNTDNDDYNDKEEIERGYNPCGEGKLPAIDKLSVLCAKYIN